MRLKIKMVYSNGRWTGRAHTTYSRLQVNQSVELHPRFVLDMEEFIILIDLLLVQPSGGSHCHALPVF